MCKSRVYSLILYVQCPGLELQVWSKVHGSSSVPSRGGDQTEDICIGCVHVDLSTLPLGLSQITGWYNITDFGGDIQGQIKVYSQQPCMYAILYEEEYGHYRTVYT